MLTHIVRHIFRMARPTNLKLGIRMEDASATGAMTSKVKGHVISLSRLGPMMYLSLEAGGGIPCRPNPAATLLV